MKKVMIVDDEVLVRLGIQSLIKWENYGYRIVCDASDGEEALQKIRQYQPDIVLTDLKMSPVDGFELISECREKYPHIQFIVLSSYNDFENVRSAMKMGAFDYVFKLTVKPEELLKIMDEATSSIDTQTEQLIQNAIDHLLTNRTSFLVAHRLSTIRKADVILVVKDGHIVEQGKHEELLRRKGYYHDLYSKQFAQESAARILGEGSAQ